MSATVAKPSGWKAIRDCCGAILALVELAAWGIVVYVALSVLWAVCKAVYPLFVIAYA